MKTILHLLSAILVLTVSAIDRDRLQFDANQPKKELSNVFPKVQVTQVKSPLIMLVLPDDDCGACQTNSPIINPEFPRVLRFEFQTSEPVNVIGLEKSIDGGLTWKPFYLDDPHLWIGLGAHRITVTNNDAYASFRLFVRNTP